MKDAPSIPSSTSTRQRIWKRRNGRRQGKHEMTMRVFGVTGWKNSGKTTLVEALVGELTGRGWQVATVKHAHHDFDIDKEGTDSFRHRKAGAKEVAIVSGRRWALMHELGGEEEPTLEEVLSRLSPADLVLVEGYKRGSHRKIEARRLEAKDRSPLTATDPNIAAIAADHPVAGEVVPVFDLDDIGGIADFIEREAGLG
jgi:molybdopterin-guanine dinucleotide biosynthesis protein B